MRLTSSGIWYLPSAVRWITEMFWLLWQFCDYCLSRLKVRLRKPWVVEVKKENEVENGAESVTMRGLADPANEAGTTTRRL
jgi:hypothetical protein